MICPLSASTAIWSLGAEACRDLAPCLSSSHSPAPNTFKPVLSTSTCSGPSSWMAPPAGPRHPSLRPAAQRRMVGNRQIKAQQIEQREHQPLALAQTKPEYAPQCQDGLDGKIGIAGLAAACLSPWRLPFSQGFRCHPHSAAAAAKPRLVLWPVRHLVFHLRYFVTAAGIVV